MLEADLDSRIDLGKICHELNRPFPKNEMIALEKKRNRNALIKLEIENIIPNYIRENTAESNKMQTFIRTENIPRAIEKYAFLVDSAIHNACSMYDCFLHIINIAVLCNKLNEKDVNGKNVDKELAKIKGCYIGNRISELRLTSEYSYLHDYDIVSKHYGVVDATFSISSGLDIPTRIGGKIRNFTYAGENHEEKWVEEIWSMYEVYYKGLHSLFMEICNYLYHIVAKSNSQ